MPHAPVSEGTKACKEANETGKPDQTKQTPQPKTPPEAFASSETNDGVHTEQVKHGLHCELARQATLPRGRFLQKAAGSKTNTSDEQDPARQKRTPAQTKTTQPQNKNKEQKHHSDQLIREVKRE